jgi:hypothetical protein
MTISEQLKEAISKLEKEINSSGKATLIFKIENWRVDKFIKSYSKSANEIGINITTN